MKEILGYLVGEIGAIYLKKAIYIALIVTFITAVLGMFASFLIAFFYFYDQVQYFLNLVSNGTGDASVNQLFGLFNCIGFTQAFNDTKSVWLTGITFIMSRIMFTYTIRTYNLFLGVLTPLLTK